MSKPRFRSRFLQRKLAPELKTPIGKLIPGPVLQTQPKVKRLISRLNPTLIVAVGDEVSRMMLDLRQNSMVLIFDRQTKRAATAPLASGEMNIFRIKNPAGFIFSEARETIKKILSAKHSAVVEVEGEEDLLALPAMAYAPLRSIVIYGQPDEGVVVSIIDEARRKFARRFMRRMEIVQ